ncbi:hypothetical protein MN116_007885 [Schistosoma mekongi]|uniref:cAMP-dependent protein kinase n=1 Tax=Schistosoma mekongi TaxID=38744 RepID=A0AAE1Z7V1_SCHME|nr:hypothetical protein MN116_007885 [Schistosoma mekongi]
MSESSEFNNILEEKSKLFHKLYNDNSISLTVQLNDFQRFRSIGHGGFGQVLLVRHIQSDTFYAMKILSKIQLVKNRQIYSAINEKRILTACNFPFIIQLHYNFKDNSYLYLVMEYVIGGELFSLLRHMKRLPNDMIKFYAAQIVLALEYLHYLTIVYRDLKPENLLINANGYIKVADLGFAKLLPKDKRTWTLCGTPDYMAPEIIMHKGYHYPVDWWAFGILLYEMTTGYPPFMHNDHLKTFEYIINGNIQFTQYFNPLLKDLIMNLIQVDLSRRYGNLKNGINDIKYHNYFNDIDWLQLYYLNIKPPYIPLCNGLNDTSHFDQCHEVTFEIADKDRFKSLFQDF